MIVGIDGGLGGGIVALNDDGSIFSTFIMPTVKGSGKNHFDITFLNYIFKNLKDKSQEKNESLTVFLEKSYVRPVSGKRACWMNGYGYGLLQGILSALNISYEIVTPQHWMKELEISSKDNKGSIMWCVRKYPLELWKVSDRAKNYHDGLTDACAIAYYGLLRCNKNVQS